MRDFESLPDCILRYLLDLCFQNVSPAYLRVDRAGRLASWGGLLDRYGIKELNSGEPVEEQIYFLEGLLPADPLPIQIRMVRTSGTRHFGIHIFRGASEDWVLLLDERVPSGPGVLEDYSPLEEH